MTKGTSASDRGGANAMEPVVSAAEIQRMLATELSLRARVGYVALLLVSLLMAIGVGSLWLTEPSLPMRTHIAFGLIVVIALSWVALAARVLANRRVLFAAHRIVAAWMSVVFSGIFVAGMLAVRLSDSEGYDAAAASLAAGCGGVMLAVAVALLLRARRNYAMLQDRRRALEGMLAGNH
jgi:hypothetical protein